VLENKEYHWGKIWVVVTNWLSSVKLSKCLNIKGYWRLININMIKNKLNGKVSFKVK